MKRVLLIDNFDSFTQMLGDYIQQCNVECHIIRYNKLNIPDIINSNYDAYIISPGPGTPNQYPKITELILQNNKHKPILGICLGHQIIGLTYGATIEYAKQPRHGKIHSINHSGTLLFNDIPELFHATRYHSLIVNNLPNELHAICYCEDEIMGLKHAFYPYYGLQFHPESCMTEYGLVMIRNFIRLI